jgi:hypothetical protein
MRPPIYAIAILRQPPCWAKETIVQQEIRRVRVGCEDTRGTQIEYQAPPGWRIIRYDTGSVGLYSVKGHTANVQANEREKPVGHRFARCPGGGRGWLQVAGIIAR